MAQRYGGKYSPTASDEAAALKELRQDERVRDAAGARSNVMFAPPVVLALMTMGEGAVSMATGLVGAGLLGLGAWLLREGLRAEAAYNLRKIAKRPAIPRKIFAAVLAGLGVGVATVFHGSGVAEAGLYGIIAGALHLAAFGIDPLKDKHVAGVDQFQQDRVAKVVDEAESYLSDIRGQIDALGDPTLTQEVREFTASAQRMIRTVEDDPRDLTGARKFLGVYLMGARDATAKFVAVWRRSQSWEARMDYKALLDDLEKNFAARTEKMLIEDRTGLDVEINVLRDRLEREGLHMKDFIEGDK